MTGTAPDAGAKAKKVWRRLSVLQRNILMAAAEAGGNVVGTARHSALEGLRDNGLIEGLSLTPLGHTVASTKPE